MKPADPQAPPGAPDDPVVSFLREHGLPAETRLAPLPGGANNRVWRVPRDHEDWVLKSYFQSPEDPRDRWGTELGFYQWLGSRGVLQVPRPLAWCERRRLALFTWLPGRKLQPNEVTSERIREALDFLRSLNASRDLPDARVLPPAAEACFSLDSHLETVDRRLARLRQINTANAAEAAASSFVSQELGPAWLRVREEICRSASQAGVSLAAPLPASERCLSPSDFGFHNALLGPDGRLRFFDFEYAGWDDPAKLVCDFFSQPELPPALDQWEWFLEELRAGLGLALDGGCPGRCRLLWPAYQVKWCCILLNEFVPAASARRAFAGVLPPDRQAVQLGKARQALAKVVAMRGGGWHSS